MFYAFYTLNLLLFLSGFFVFYIRTGDGRFILSLVRTLMGLPLMAGVYLCLIYHTTPQTISLVFFSETVFALIWFSTAFWPAKSVSDEIVSEYTHFLVFEICMGLAILAIGLYCLLGSPAPFPAVKSIAFSQSGIFIFTNTFLLISAIFSAWRLEGFWRSLNPTQRWEYKFLVVGSYLVCCTLGWAVSYRFIYHRMSFEHFRLLSAIFLFAWGLMLYAVIRHRLLKRKLFVDRKVVFVTIAPLAFGTYLIFIGIIALAMHYLNQPFPVVLRWLLSVAGLVVIALLTVSGKVRHDIKYFISTNFYTNKYEYRDEWLKYSRLLHNALTETEVVSALRQVLAESLYTIIIFIWTGDEEGGYRLVFHKETSPEKKEKDYYLPKGHPLISRIKTSSWHYVKRTKHNISQFPVPDFFPDPNLVLFVPLTIGENMVGIIGLGPEFTGGLYGQDDFDLMMALGSQAASALMAARMAEKFAKAKQQEAWDVMSAFVLHDVKNAASMLSMTRQNAPDHIHDPEFQEDMLEAIDDSLKRMNKVQNRLSELRGDIVPVLQDIDLSDWLKDCCQKLKKRLHGLEVKFSCEETIIMKADAELLGRLMENLLLNALEAGGKGTIAEVKLSSDSRQVRIDLTDNGPGLDEEMLPDALFEPFKTNKPGGSGVGLWQAKRLTDILSGNIIAENSDRGARFLITLPIGKI